MKRRRTGLHPQSLHPQSSYLQWHKQKTEDVWCYSGFKMKNAPDGSMTVWEIFPVRINKSLFPDHHSETHCSWLMLGWNASSFPESSLCCVTSACQVVCMYLFNLYLSIYLTVIWSDSPAWIHDPSVTCPTWPFTQGISPGQIRPCWVVTVSWGMATTAVCAAEVIVYFSGHVEK